MSDDKRSALRKELLALVHRFGAESCEEELELVVGNYWDYPSRILPEVTGLAFPENYDIHVYGESDTVVEDLIIGEIELLREWDFTGTVSNFTLQVGHMGSLSQRLIDTIIATFDHYFKRDGPGSWNSFAFKETAFSTVHRILDHPSIALFREVTNIGTDDDEEEHDDSNLAESLLASFQLAFSRGDFPNALRIFNVTMRGSYSTFLGGMLSANIVNKLYLSCSKINQVDDILKGIELSKSVPIQDEADLHTKYETKTLSRGLTEISIHHERTPEDFRNNCLILRALRGHPTLRRLQLQVNAEIIDETGFLNEVGRILKDPLCQLGEVQLGVFGEAFASSLHQFYEAVKMNRSVRKFTFTGQLSLDNEASLYRLAMSPNSPISEICVNDRLTDTTESIKKARADIDSEHQHSESDLEDLYHKCHLRRLHLSWTYEHIGIESDMQILCEEYLEFLKDLICQRLPFLFDVRVSPAFQTVANRVPGTELLWSKLGVWVERNQVGRALLHASVIDTIPSSLWSIVLEKAGKSKHAELEEGVYATVRIGDNPSKIGLPPLDGIYYLVQRLFQANIVPGGHVPKVSKKRGRDMSLIGSFSQAAKKRREDTTCIIS